jgi:hypothetical protein
MDPPEERRSWYWKFIYDITFSDVKCVAVPPLQSPCVEGDMAKRQAAKRELINTGTDKRYVRRDARGRFGESDDVGRATAQDRRRAAASKAKKGQGDRGDR